MCLGTDCIYHFLFEFVMFLICHFTLKSGFLVFNKGPRSKRKGSQ